MNIFKCSTCNTEITPERLEGLNFLGITDQKKMTCLKCAESLVKAVKGIYLGESGSSSLLLVNSVSDKDGIEKLS